MNDLTEKTLRTERKYTGKIISVDLLKFLTTIICTPGYCEERIHIYFADSPVRRPCYHPFG